MPTISICLPTLNARKFLEERMSSIFAQTVTDWELIVCDSFSDDGTWEYLQRFIDDPRVRLYQVPREGLYAGWNECIKRIRGDYVYIATADDTMEPECLQGLMRPMLNDPEIGLVLSEVQRIDEFGRPLPTTRADIWNILDPKPGEVKRLGGNIMFLLIAGLGMGLSSVTGFLLRRRIFENAGMFPTDLGFLGDAEWSLRAVLETDIAVISGKLATWRVHATQASSVWSFRSAMFFVQSLERVLIKPNKAFPARWKQVPDWQDRILMARRIEAELNSGLFIFNIKKHWRNFPRWIWEVANVAPYILMKRILAGFSLPETHRVKPMDRLSSMFEDFGEIWPVEFGQVAIKLE